MDGPYNLIADTEDKLKELETQVLDVLDRFVPDEVLLAARAAVRLQFGDLLADFEDWKSKMDGNSPVERVRVIALFPESIA